MCTKRAQTIHTKVLLFFYEHNLCKFAIFVKDCRFVQIMLFLLQKILAKHQKKIRSFE